MFLDQRGRITRRHCRMHRGAAVCAIRRAGGGQGGVATACGDGGADGSNGVLDRGRAGKELADDLPVYLDDGEAVDAIRRIVPLGVLDEELLSASRRRACFEGGEINAVCGGTTSHEGDVVRVDELCRARL